MSELEDFVLDFYRVNGAIVEPPRYGIHQVLLPETLAERLGAPAWQEIVFGQLGPDEGDDKLYLTPGHPLVERIVERARQDPAPTQAFINNINLSKQGLIELSGQKLHFPNAWLAEAPYQVEHSVLFHYLLFTFKVTLRTDEQQEHLASVAMNAQTGWTVDWQSIRQRATFGAEPEFDHLRVASPVWMAESDPLARPVLAGLLERAKVAVIREISDVIERLRRRSIRYLQLDRARLQQYYADMEADLQRRLERTSEDRRASLEDKIASVCAERELKLADAEARYRLRTDVELITVEVVVQPKIMLNVLVQDRRTTVQRRLVWDPLLHRIEPLPCDVCGLPGQTLWLCSGGHLVHDGCRLDRQCIDCKRVYCRLCEGHMKQCVVCGQPVCSGSLNKCPKCGRGTCRQHVGLCHAEAHPE